MQSFDPRGTDRDLNLASPVQRRRSTPRGLVTVLAAALALVAGVLLAPAPAQATARAARVGSSFDAKVLAYTNAARARHHLRPLRMASCPDRFATRWNHRLASHDRMYHQSLRPIMRRCHLHTAGENLAWRGRSLSARQVVSMWLHSPGHRANILNRHYRYLGVSAWRSAHTGRVYAGQVFGG